MIHGVTIGSQTKGLLHQKKTHKDKVQDLINQNTRTWDAAKLSDVFDQETKEKIEKIPLSIEPSNDRRIWIPSKDGVFSTKSAYSALSIRGDESVSELWNAIWKLKVPARIQLFVWKALKGVITETIMHALVTCKILTRVWQLINIQIDQFQDITFMQWIKYWLQIYPYQDLTSRAEQLPLITAMLWSIWESRNEIVHTIFKKNRWPYC